MPTLPPRIGGSRSRLCELRTALLSERDGFAPKLSGGDRRTDWPPEARCLLLEFLPLQNPPDYQLVADELKRLCEPRAARPLAGAQLRPSP